MPSNKPPLKDVLKKHEDSFNALATYDETGKMPRLNRKVRIDITLDANLLRDAKRIYTRKGMKLSTRIEALLREDLENER